MPRAPPLPQSTEADIFRSQLRYSVSIVQNMYAKWLHVFLEDHKTRSALPNFQCPLRPITFVGDAFCPSVCAYGVTQTSQISHPPRDTIVANDSFGEFFQQGWDVFRSVADHLCNDRRENMLLPITGIRSGPSQRGIEVDFLENDVWLEFGFRQGGRLNFRTPDIPPDSCYENTKKIVGFI